MIRIICFELLFVIIFFFNSYTQVKLEKRNQEILTGEIDNIIVDYWNSYKAETHYFIFNGQTLLCRKSLYKSWEDEKKKMKEFIKQNPTDSIKISEYITTIEDYDIQHEKEYYSFKKEISDINIINKLFTYLNMFYIEKEEKIDFGINGEEEFIADFPIITFIGLKDGEEKIKQSTTLSNHIKFNPKFLEFYDFLDSLVREPFRQ